MTTNHEAMEIYGGMKVDVVFIGAVLLFFLGCFGLIAFFDTLSRSQKE